MVTTPLSWRQQLQLLQQQRCLCINGNKAIMIRATISSTMSNKGNDASLTTVETPAHWWWQQCNCDESNNCHCNNGKDTCTLTATTPSCWGQRCQIDNEQQGGQRKHAHTCKQTYHMFVFAHTANISYVPACKPAHEPSKPFLWASTRQISPLPCLPPLFCNIRVQKFGSIVCAKTRKCQQQLYWCFNNKLLILVCT